MTVASIAVTDLGGHMASAVEGLDLRRPIGADTAALLRRTLLERLALCIRGQALGDPEYLQAMRLFGQPLPQLRVATHSGGVPEIIVLSSEDRDVLGDGKRIVVGAHWHTDDSFKAVPCALTMLYGVVVPPVGGDTQFTNMYAAHDALDAAMRARIAGLRVIHRYDSSRKGTKVAKLSAEEQALVPDAVHPLVRTHPETGRKALYLNPNRMEQIVGMARGDSDRLLDELTAHAIQPSFQYRHKWRQGDILVWDNRCTMHKANADYPEGARREMHRIITEGTVPV
jgi:taurine dioxygenase